MEVEGLAFTDAALLVSFNLWSFFFFFTTLRPRVE